MNPTNLAFVGGDLLKSFTISSKKFFEDKTLF